MRNKNSQNIFFSEIKGKEINIIENEFSGRFDNVFDIFIVWCLLPWTRWVIRLFLTLLILLFGLLTRDSYYFTRWTMWLLYFLYITRSRVWFITFVRWLMRAYIYIWWWKNFNIWSFSSLYVFTCLRCYNPRLALSIILGRKPILWYFCSLRH